MTDVTEIFRTQAYTKHAMNIDLEFYRTPPLSERAGIATAIVAQLGRAVRPTVAVFVVMLTVWAMPGIEPSNRDDTARVAITVTR